ncbi:hypothetical protein MLD38_020025 [Melastoma candidum]|uniref:Uncharacterized protein n=1 Tax=Melastoma candidum TaxID=119954 RepID=A0ACB9QCL5_9MYRT|nr:hypothetical protein MLD38_020025 [Melastoma candidum]
MAAFSAARMLTGCPFPERVIDGGTCDRRRGAKTVRMSVASDAGTSKYEEGNLALPKWAGKSPLARLLGTLISFKPFYSVLKQGARDVLISTAEKNNIPWRAMTKEILHSDVYMEFETIRDPSLVYPDYYLNPFHAYEDGNLSWLAAAEVEAATLSLFVRAIPEASSKEEASLVIRGNWLKAIRQHLERHSGNLAVNDILDIGCSVGISTNHLADAFPSAHVTGLDLSPYFLSVAKHKEKKRAPRKNPIRWIHANGEATGLPSKSFDLVSFALVLHECPVRATVNLLEESMRLLRPGGTLVVMDQAPESKVIQDLPPVLFTVVKSTEPFLDEYYLLDLKKAIEDAGFLNVSLGLTDPRHRTVTASAPY